MSLNEFALTNLSYLIRSNVHNETTHFPTVKCKIDDNKGDWDKDGWSDDGYETSDPTASPSWKGDDWDKGGFLISCYI